MKKLKKINIKSLNNLNKDLELSESDMRNTLGGSYTSSSYYTSTGTITVTYSESGSGIYYYNSSRGAGYDSGSSFLAGNEDDNYTG